MHEQTRTCTKSYMIAVSRSDNSHHFERCVQGLPCLPAIADEGMLLDKGPRRSGRLEDAEY